MPCTVFPVNTYKSESKRRGILNSYYFICVIDSIKSCSIKYTHHYRAVYSVPFPSRGDESPRVRGSIKNTSLYFYLSDINLLIVIFNFTVNELNDH